MIRIRYWLASFLGLFLFGTGCSETRTVGFFMYSSSDQGTTWSRSYVPVSNATTDTVVDPSALLLPNGDILLYYLASNGTGDPAFEQPDNTWRIGYARSTDNGRSFTQEAIIYQQNESISDPSILQYGYGFRLYFLDAVNNRVVSLGSNGQDPTSWATTLDTGNRADGAGTPGALQVGSSTIMYGCPNVNSISYYESNDTLTFNLESVVVDSETTDHTLCDASVRYDSGQYIMAYKVQEPGSTDPQDNTIFWATGSSHTSFTTRGIIGYGSVPALVVDQNGVWRVYSPNYTPR